jgi:hypothetical protein
MGMPVLQRQTQEHLPKVLFGLHERLGRLPPRRAPKLIDTSRVNVARSSA